MLRLRTGIGLLAVLLGVAAGGGGGLGQEADWDAAKERALGGLEHLRAEVRVLEALSGLQARLLEWNAVLAASGVAPASLEAALCEAPEVRVWCRILPATFGRGQGDADERG